MAATPQNDREQAMKQGVAFAAEVTSQQIKEAKALLVLHDLPIEPRNVLALTKAIATNWSAMKGSHDQLPSGMIGGSSVSGSP